LLPFKDVKIKIYKTVILPVVLYRYLQLMHKPDSVIKRIVACAVIATEVTKKCKILLIWRR